MAVRTTDVVIRFTGHERRPRRRHRLALDMRRKERTLEESENAHAGRAYVPAPPASQATGGSDGTHHRSQPAGSSRRGVGRHGDRGGGAAAGQRGGAHPAGGPRARVPRGQEGGGSARDRPHALRSAGRRVPDRRADRRWVEARPGGAGSWGGPRPRRSRQTRRASTPGTGTGTAPPSAAPVPTSRVPTTGRHGGARGKWPRPRWALTSGRPSSGRGIWIYL